MNLRDRIKNSKYKEQFIKNTQNNKNVTDEELEKFKELSKKVKKLKKED